MNKDEFLNHVSTLTNLSKEKSEAVTLIVLSTLSHRLNEGEASDVWQQLPKGIRELWTSETHDTLFAHYSNKRLEYKTVEEMFDLIEKEFNRLGIDADPKTSARSVIHVLKDQIDKGEMNDLRSQLPLEMKIFWDSI